MNRKDIAQSVAESLNLDRNLVDKVMVELFATIAWNVADGERVMFSDFGVFAPTIRGARKARNPHTNEAVTVPERVIPQFRPAKAFKAQVAEHLTVGTVEA